MSSQLQLNILPPVFRDENYFEFAPKTKRKKVAKCIPISEYDSTSTKPELTLIPTISIHPKSITYYNQIVWQPHKPVRRESDRENQSEFRTHKHLLSSSRTAEGNVSAIAKRKIKKAIDYLLLLTSDKLVTSVSTGRRFNFKIAFITLTLPSQQIHDDNVIKRTCLNSFLLELQKYYGVKNYVWRAEKQKNGSIHFHVIVDKFINWNELRNRWNRIVNKLGYVDRYREKMKEFYKDGFVLRNDLIKNWSEVKQKRAYKANLETGYNNPNSTDIHSIKKIRNLTHYFIKYLTKNETPPILPSPNPEDYIKQKGRIWGSSKNLQNIKGARISVDWELEAEIKSISESKNVKVYSSDYFSVISVNFSRLAGFGASRIFTAFCEYLNKEFGYNYQFSI